MSRKKVGIMGGTFDPIHVGHLILGESAYHQFALDEVWFMPSGNPPHKPHREGRGTIADRIEMVRLAIADNPHFRLSCAEAHEEGYTYTKETLLRLTREHPDTDYYFIMGADSLFSFADWREPQEIARLCTLVAAVRDHVSLSGMQEQIAFLQKEFGADIRTLETPNMDISSQLIRSWIKKGDPAKYYLPDSVITYIQETGLYQV